MQSGEFEAKILSEMGMRGIICVIIGDSDKKLIRNMTQREKLVWKAVRESQQVRRGGFKLLE